MHRVVIWVAGLISAPSRLRAALLAVGLVLTPTLATAQTWQYLYDEVGRLKSAIAPSGDRADYEYDAVGNIVAIRRSGASALNISEFTPQIGKSGTSVTLLGSGFSTTPANNTVKFNGVTATVTAATVTQLTVTAPATGSTGLISVTVGAATVTTREAFVYSSTIVTGPPTISGATPSCADPGTTVTLTGTNFDVAPGATRVELGPLVAPTSVASPSSLSFVTPIGATSSMRVVTPLGISAVSAQLFVPPVVGTCAAYEAPVRPVLNGAASALNIGTPGKKAVVMFSGNAGAALSLQFSNIAPSVAGSTLSYFLYDPANASIASGSVSPISASIHVPLLPATGAYAVVVYWSDATATGTASVSLRSNSALSTSGAALAQSVTGPGQSVRVTIVGTAGRDWTVDISGVTLAGGGSSMDYRVRRSDGVTVISGGCTPAGVGCSSVWYGMTAGTHTMVLTPNPSPATGSMTLKSWMSNRVTGSLTIGTTATYTSTVPGQVVQYTFSGTAGQQLGLALSSFTTSVSGATLRAVVVNPDGTDLTSTTFTAANTTPAAWVQNLAALPTTGTYTVRVHPFNSGNAQMTTTFSGQVLVTQDVAATLATNGTATVINLPQTGQQARVTFAAIAGQDWTFDMSGLTLSAGGQYMQYQVLRSDGISIASGSCYPSGSGCSMAWKPTTAGTHSVILTPYPASATGSVTLKSWASSRITGTLTLGTAATFTTTVPGQAVAYTFGGTAGDRRELSLSGFTTSVAGALLTAEVRRPDGVLILSHNFSAANTSPTSRILELPALPTTGTYSAVVFPYLSGNVQQTTTFSGQMLFAADAPDVLATDGSVIGIYMDASQPGTRTVSFTGVAGKDWTLDVSNLALSTGGSNVQYQVFQNGTVSMGWSSCSPGVSSCSFTWLAMTAGTHTIVFTRVPAGISAAFNLRSWVSNRVTGTLTAGSPSTLTTTVPGQMAEYTFSGNAGQQISIAFSNFTTSVSGASLSAGVLSLTGGSSFTGAQTTPSPYVLNLPPLPTTGTYTLQVSPQSSATTFTGQVTLSVGGTFLTDGTPTTVTFSTPGATVDLSFTATYDDELTVQLSQLALNGGTNDTVQYTLVTPNTYTYPPFTCSESGANCALTWIAFNQEGTYKLRLTAQAGLTGSVRVQAWKYQPLTGVLYVGSFPVTMTTTLPSQTARYTFDGFTGQRVRLTLSNASSSTGASGVFAQVFTPSYGYVGMVFINVGAGPQFVDLPALTTDGEYRVVVQAVSFGHKFSVQVRLDPY